VSLSARRTPPSDPANAHFAAALPIEAQPIFAPSPSHQVIRSASCCNLQGAVLDQLIVVSRKYDKGKPWDVDIQPLLINILKKNSALVPTILQPSVLPERLQGTVHPRMYIRPDMNAASVTDVERGSPKEVTIAMTSKTPMFVKHIQDQEYHGCVSSNHVNIIHTS
jgi:hypothetical protein